MNDEVAPLKTALVTGVAGYIGDAVSKELRRRGIHVFGVDSRIPLGSEWKDSFMRADLGSGETLPSFSLPFDALDYVFHVAGGALKYEVESEDLVSDVPLIEETIRVNFISAVDVVHATRGKLRTGGSVTLVSSINALGDFGLPIYSSSKAALHGLINSLAAPLWAEQIRFNAAALGTVDHPGVRALHASDPRHFDRLRAALPGHTLLTPADVAEAIVHIGVDELETWGKIVVVDNGQLAQSRNR